MARLPRALHPGAWWLWALGMAAAASRTTNPILLLLIVGGGGVRGVGVPHRGAVGARVPGVRVPRSSS